MVIRVYFSSSKCTFVKPRCSDTVDGGRVQQFQIRRPWARSLTAASTRYCAAFVFVGWWWEGGEGLVESIRGVELPPRFLFAVWVAALQELRIQRIRELVGKDEAGGSEMTEEGDESSGQPFPELPSWLLKTHPVLFVVLAPTSQNIVC